MFKFKNKKTCVLFNVCLLLFTSIASLSCGITFSLYVSLKNSPQLFAHVVDYPYQYYQAQTERVSNWQKLCLSIGTTLCLVIFICLLFCILINALNARNYFNEERKAEKLAQKKQAKIEKLQSNIAKLKDD